MQLRLLLADDVQRKVNKYSTIDLRKFHVVIIDEFSFQRSGTRDT